MKKSSVKDVYVVTAAAIDIADRKSKRNVFLNEVNEMIRSLAVEYDIGIIDMAEAFDQAVVSVPGFYEQSRIERHSFLMDIYEKKLVNLIGLQEFQ